MITVTVDYIDGSDITNDIRAVDPTLGDGTINAIISYKTHTFIV